MGRFEAMRLGTRWGYLGMVKEILRELKSEMGAGRIRVCATGGYAGWVLKGLKGNIHFDHDLTLFGLGTIYERNHPSG